MSSMKTQGPADLTACPICDTRIQSTRTVYMSDLVLSGDGTEILDDGRDSGVDGDTRVYCAEDHTQAEMIAHLDLLEFTQLVNRRVQTRGQE